MSDRLLYYRGPPTGPDLVGPIEGCLYTFVDFGLPKGLSAGESQITLSPGARLAASMNC